MQNFYYCQGQFLKNASLTIILQRQVCIAIQIITIFLCNGKRYDAFVFKIENCYYETLIIYEQSNLLHYNIFFNENHLRDQNITIERKKNLIKHVQFLINKSCVLFHLFHHHFYFIFIKTILPIFLLELYKQKILRIL